MRGHHRIHLRGGDLVIGRTGAVVPLSAALAREVVRRAVFAGAVGAIRLVRRIARMRRARKANHSGGIA